MKVFKWVLIFLLGYFSIKNFLSVDYIFVDYFNLLMHEAGHLIFTLFGETISFLGGTLMQLGIPILCGAMLLAQQNDRFGGGLCGWWLGENLVNVGRYMADAKYQFLPLIGGEHDWAYLFESWGLINYSELIGNVVKFFGMVIMILMLGWLFYLQTLGEKYSQNS